MANEHRKIIVTGATGFIGTRLCMELQRRGHELYALLRPTSTRALRVRCRSFSLEDGGGSTTPLRGADCVVHLAGRAHVVCETDEAPLTAFRDANCGNTLRVAKAAMEAGVKRFIYVSSIGVNGGGTVNDPFHEGAPAEPVADYARSKHEAEERLRTLLQGSAMELVIVRPPLVYAGHAPGNFQRLLKAVAARMPLPFAAVDNRRSLIALDNLVDFIGLCVEHRAAANQLFVVADESSLSTGQIVRLLAEGMGKRSRLLAIPDALMRVTATLLGRRAAYTQLCGSLVIDSSKAHELLGWRPPLATDEALRQAGADYLAERDSPEGQRCRA